VRQFDFEFYSGPPMLDTCLSVVFTVSEFVWWPIIDITDLSKELSVFYEW